MNKLNPQDPESAIVLQAENHRLVESLHCKYQNDLSKFIHSKIKRNEDADDIIQEVYLRIIRLKDTRHIDNPRAFLFKTAQNVIIDRYRQNNAQQGDSHIAYNDDICSSEQYSPEKITQAKQRYSLFLLALEELNNNCRTAFMLNRFSNLPYKEIAKLMGVSVAMVEYHIMRALSHIRKVLRDSE